MSVKTQQAHLNMYHVYMTVFNKHAFFEYLHNPTESPLKK